MLSLTSIRRVAGSADWLLDHRAGHIRTPHSSAIPVRQHSVGSTKPLAFVSDSSPAIWWSSSAGTFQLYWTVEIVENPDNAQGSCFALGLQNAMEGG